MKPIKNPNSKPDTNKKTPKKRLGGRSARIREAVFQAVLELLNEKGYDALSISEVAKKAEVHETSIYRRWESKSNLVIQAVMEKSNQEIPIPNTGALRMDLLELLKYASDYLQSADGNSVIQMAVMTMGNEEMALSKHSFWKEKNVHLSIIFERAVTRGEIHANLDWSLLIELLLGPLYFRKIMSEKELNEEMITFIVDTALHGIEI
ncbi:TetR/AcrR family transcriptional regulator [Shimazuella sp. AN120528]|uniref:TetR/AcrR family transcriptional regulator n=1 Tax=Shimazuella soli TaxID=1892854 RepID=UPI001F0E04D9|nr:TetR/AcrR family transcriptional regulator [Shimazuella soli]MCH5584918.1 TetR/AcrR family transcriptional regulator [Shimazuella soli]